MREWTGNWVAELCTKQQYSSDYEISEQYLQARNAPGRPRVAPTNFPEFPIAASQIERQDSSSDVTVVNEGQLHRDDQILYVVQSSANAQRRPAGAQQEDQDLEHHDRTKVTPASIVDPQPIENQESVGQGSEQSLNPNPENSAVTPTPPLPIGRVISTMIRQLIAGLGGGEPGVGR